MKKILILFPLTLLLSGCFARYVGLYQYIRSGRFSELSIGDILYVFLLLTIVLGIFFFVIRIINKEKPQEERLGVKIGYWLAKNLENFKKPNSSKIKSPNEKKNSDVTYRLEELKKLLDNNTITQQEYEEQRKKIIGDV